MKLKLENEDISVMRIFCIGKNYPEHVREMGGAAAPESPVIFMKPQTSLVGPGSPIQYPAHGADLNFEVEVVLLIGKEGQPKNDQEALQFISGLSLGLDLTLRDIQAFLKSKGFPWEKSKSFDQAAAVGTFKRYDQTYDLKNIEFSCSVNNVLRQTGNTNAMIFPVERLIREISSIWQLFPGDLVYTGTPAGVGSLKRGDTIEVCSDLIGQFSWSIC
jgi:2-keto-4-pentenoate hydratase/2-oxohepta-3-ene-1,7-dioic acid hydratase in catechol pathway